MLVFKKRKTIIRTLITGRETGGITTDSVDIKVIIKSYRALYNLDEVHEFLKTDYHNHLNMK